MTKNEILNYFNEKIKFGKRLTISEQWFSSHFNETYNDFLNYSFPKTFKFQQRLYHYLHDDLDFLLGICPQCGNRCKFVSFLQGYRTYCSPKCSNSALDKIEVYKKSCIEKYGVDNAAKLESSKEKQRKTCNERYGVDNPFKVEKFKEKYKETCFELYGVT